jgi:hypothetical protein
MYVHASRLPAGIQHSIPRENRCAPTAPLCIICDHSTGIYAPAVVQDGGFTAGFLAGHQHLRRAAQQRRARQAAEHRRGRVTPPIPLPRCSFHPDTLHAIFLCRRSPTKQQHSTAAEALSPLALVHKSCLDRMRQNRAERRCIPVTILFT